MNPTLGKNESRDAYYPASRIESSLQLSVWIRARIWEKRLNLRLTMSQVIPHYKWTQPIWRAWWIQMIWLRVNLGVDPIVKIGRRPDLWLIGSSTFLKKFTRKIQSRIHPDLWPESQKEYTSLIQRYVLAVTASKVHVPRSPKYALTHQGWISAMQLEIEALHLNQTWTLIDRSPLDNVINSKWVFKVKQNPDGSIERLKACLIANGIRQVERADYNTTFSLVVKPVSIRLVLDHDGSIVQLKSIPDWYIKRLPTRRSARRMDYHEPTSRLRRWAESASGMFVEQSLIWSQVGASDVVEIPPTNQFCWQ